MWRSLGVRTILGTRALPISMDRGPVLMRVRTGGMKDHTAQIAVDLAMRRSLGVLTILGARTLPISTLRDLVLSYVRISGTEESMLAFVFICVCLSVSGFSPPAGGVAVGRWSVA
jgi:hypothetical protein